jgi:hypothetical protein
MLWYVQEAHTSTMSLLSLLAGVGTLCMENQSCVGISSLVTKCASLARQLWCSVALGTLSPCSCARQRYSQQSSTLHANTLCLLLHIPHPGCCVDRTRLGERSVAVNRRSVSSAPQRLRCPLARLVCARALRIAFLLYVRSRSSCAASLVRQVCAA